MSGAEALAVGRYDEHLHIVVLVGAGQGGVVHVPHLLRRLDVGLFGDVEDNPSDRSVLLVDDRLEWHPLHDALCGVVTCGSPAHPGPRAYGLGIVGS